MVVKSARVKIDDRLVGSDFGIGRRVNLVDDEISGVLELIRADLTVLVFNEVFRVRLGVLAGKHDVEMTVFTVVDLGHLARVVLGI